MKIFKSILSVLMIFLMTLIGVVRWHHHDCNGNVFVSLNESIDIVFGATVEVISGHPGHCHHHHSCENCCLKTIDCFSSERDSGVDFKFMDLAAVEIPADLKPRRDIDYDGGIYLIPQEDYRIKIPDFVSGTLSFRAPPVETRA